VVQMIWAIHATGCRECKELIPTDTPSCLNRSEADPLDPEIRGGPHPPVMSHISHVRADLQKPSSIPKGWAESLSNWFSLASTCPQSTRVTHTTSPRLRIQYPQIHGASNWIPGNPHRLPQAEPRNSAQEYLASQRFKQLGPSLVLAWSTSNWSSLDPHRHLDSATTAFGTCCG
jgi:hypothetical protein